MRCVAKTNKFGRDTRQCQIDETKKNVQPVLGMCNCGPERGRTKIYTLCTYHLKKYLRMKGIYVYDNDHVIYVKTENV